MNLQKNAALTKVRATVLGTEHSVITGADALRSGRAQADNERDSMTIDPVRSIVRGEGLILMAAFRRV